MPDLTTGQRERLRQDLQTLAARLRAEIESHKHLPNRSQEVDDDAVADLEGDLDVADLERDVKELEAVERALARLHEPGFGICADCEEAIPFSRLSASPAAMRCIACQTRHERASGLPPSSRL